MAEEAAALTKEEVEQGIEEVVTGTKPYVYRGEGLVFRRLTLSQKTKATLHYKKRLFALMEEGELPSEAVLENIIKKEALKHGVDPQVLEPETQLRLLRTLYDISADVFSPGTEVTMETAGKIHEELSDEDRRLIIDLATVQRLRQELSGCSAESVARAEQFKMEMVLGIYKEDGTQKWSSIEELEAEPDDAELLALTRAYRAFTQGMSLDFLSSSPRQSLGGRGGKSQKRTRTRSSKARSGNGRKTK